jgi:hypothetical protein
MIAVTSSGEDRTAQLYFRSADVANGFIASDLSVRQS